MMYIGLHDSYGWQCDLHGSLTRMLVKLTMLTTKNHLEVVPSQEQVTLAIIIITALKRLEQKET